MRYPFQQFNSPGFTEVGSGAFVHCVSGYSSNLQHTPNIAAIA